MRSPWSVAPSAEKHSSRAISRLDQFAVLEIKARSGRRIGTCTAGVPVRFQTPLKVPGPATTEESLPPLALAHTLAMVPAN